MTNILPDLAALSVDIDLVDTDPNNVNVHPEEQIESLQQTLRVYGQHKPLVVQERGGRFLCRVGNGTLEAARREGWTHIAVVRADNDDDVKATARAIRDNTASWGSEFDDRTLRQQLAQIHENDADLAHTLGWEFDDISELLADTSVLSQAIAEADKANAQLMLDSRLDGGEDDVEVDKSTRKYTPEELDEICEVDEDISVSADEVCDWLDNHPPLAADVLVIISDIFFPAKFYAVKDPATGKTLRHAYVVSDDE